MKLSMLRACCSGGSAKQARDRQFQAVLPLRGKILNVERKDDAALYKNNEISNLIVALGLGLKGQEMVNLRWKGGDLVIYLQSRLENDSVTVPRIPVPRPVFRWSARDEHADSIFRMSRMKA